MIQNASQLLIKNEIWLEGDDSYPFIKIKNSHAEATIALHGAHLTSYIPAGQEPVIFTSSEAVYKEGKAIRGGIPVCWPWFSAHPTDSSQPAHGFARNNFWELVSTASEPEYTELVFEFSKDDLSATLAFRIGEHLGIVLTTTNNGSEPVTVGGALHSYFCVSDISNISISGLGDVEYVDSLVGQNFTQEGDITFAEEVDRVYINTEHTAAIHDSGNNRAIVIQKSGSLSTVVWNPWIEKSKSMGDLHNEEYKKFVCIETTNALDDVYLLENGQCHSMAANISTVLGK